MINPANPHFDLFSVRSMLFLPASNPRAIAKARASDADFVILDLEDAVKVEQKGDARTAAVEELEQPWPMPVAVRVNGVGTQWHADDVAALASSKVGFIVLPRASSQKDVRDLGNAAGKPVLAMIETAAAVLGAQEIATDSAALIMGTNDLRADLRLPPGGSRAAISTALQFTVLAARAAGIPVFDGVFNSLNDPKGLLREAAEGRGLGFDGKSLIHPNQIQACHEAFSPAEGEITRARALVDAFTGGAERFEDEMIERMHVETARRILARAGQ